MPNNSIIAEGKTTNEAIENGLKILKVSKNMVNIKVIEEEKRSFFSILAPRVVKVELSIKEGEETTKVDLEEPKIIKKEKHPVNQQNLHKAEENVKIFLDEILMKLGSSIKYSLSQDEYGLKVEIHGEESAFLIGFRGETLYAFQSLISAIANKNITEKVRVLLDIEDYKAKRERTLQSLARRIARNVEKTKKSVTLEPMQAYERKIIHSALQNSKTVKTTSIGEEPRRRVVISLK